MGLECKIVGRKWTLEEQQKMEDMMEQGYTVGDVAKELGRSLDSIRKIRSALIQEGKIERSKNHTVWEKEEVIKLKTMMAKGKSKEHIAKALNRTVNSVKSKCTQISRGNDPTLETEKTEYVSDEAKKMIELDNSTISFIKFKYRLKKEIEITGEFNGKKVAFVSDRYFVILHPNYRETLSYHEAYTLTSGA